MRRYRYVVNVLPGCSRALQAEPDRILGKSCAPGARELVLFDGSFNGSFFKQGCGGVVIELGQSQCQHKMLVPEFAELGEQLSDLIL